MDMDRPNDLLWHFSNGWARTLQRFDHDLAHVQHWEDIPQDDEKASIIAANTNTSSVISQPTLESMPQFILLPTEIRLKIWRYASQHRRTLELTYCIADRRFLPMQFPPNVLHICRESREIGLKYYHLSFGTDTYPPSTYFNSNNDIIYFGSRQYPDELRYVIKHFLAASPNSQDSTHIRQIYTIKGIPLPIVPVHNQIQYLAIAQHHWTTSYFLRTTESAHKLFRQFPYLKQLIFVQNRFLLGEGFGFSTEAEKDFATRYGFEEKWEDNAGVKWVEAPYFAMTMNQSLGNAWSAIRELKKSFPNQETPDVVVVVYGRR